LLSVAAIMLSIQAAYAESKKFQNFESFCNDQPLKCGKVGISAKLSLDDIYGVHDGKKTTADIAQTLQISNSNVKIVDQSESRLFLLPGQQAHVGGYAAIAKKEVRNPDTGRETVVYTIVFKGTTPTKLQDIVSDLVALPVPLNPNSDVKAHAGFRTYAHTVFNDQATTDMVKDIQDAKNGGKDVDVLITGHSLGGAAAQLYAAYLADAGVLPQDMNIVTFGAPPPAQASFAQKYPEVVSRITRVETRGDGVLDAPRAMNLYQTNGLEYFGQSVIEEAMPEDFRKLLDEKDALDRKIEKLKPLAVLKSAEIGALKVEQVILVGKIDNRSFLGIHTGYGHLRDDFTRVTQNSDYQKRLENALREDWLQKEALLSLRNEGNNYPSQEEINLKKRYLLSKIYGSSPSFDTTAEQNAAMTNNLSSCITQFTTSHIGSAGCYFVHNTPVQDDSVSRSVVRDQEYAGAKIPSIQEANQYTNGQIVKAPLDIGLTWNQNTQLDLDSHLVTPNNEHVYFLRRGKLDAAPNAFLYRDSIPDPNINSSGLRGAEQTRIDAFQSGEYRFYVNNFSQNSKTPAAQAAGTSGLSNSGAQVQIYEGGDKLTNTPNDPNIFDLNNPNVQRVGKPYPGESKLNVPTNQEGNTWYVFKLDTRTGILYKVNRFGNVNSPSEVPNFR
jgi:pimeloyl-ACP methyl ester carboxylesterase